MLYGKCERNTQRMITKRFTLVTGDHIEKRIIQNVHLQSEFSKVSSLTGNLECPEQTKPFYKCFKFGFC